MTKRGVAPLWDIPSDPLVDALGTGLVVLPEPSSSEETQQEHGRFYVSLIHRECEFT